MILNDVQRLQELDSQIYELEKERDDILQEMNKRQADTYLALIGRCYIKKRGYCNPTYYHITSYNRGLDIFMLHGFSPVKNDLEIFVSNKRPDIFFIGAEEITRHEYYQALQDYMNRSFEKMAFPLRCINTNEALPATHQEICYLEDDLK